MGWGVDRTTDIALERAFNGEVRPIFIAVAGSGKRLVHDNRLAIAVLGRLDRSQRFRGADC